MVKEKRLKRKLPALLIDLPTTGKEGAAELARKERGLRRLERTNPPRFFSLFSNFAQSVKEIDQELTRQAQLEITVFEDSFKKKKRR